LADFLLDADEKQFAALYPKFTLQEKDGLPVLITEVERKLPPDAAEQDKERLAKRQASAAVALLRMNHSEKVWPLLKRTGEPEDPRVRSYLIHRFGPLGADAEVLVRRFQTEPDVTIRRALILSLGPEEFGEESWTAKELLVQQLQEIYRTAADTGLRAAAEWLLRQWHKKEWLDQADLAWAEDAEQRRKRLASIEQELRTEKEKATPQWYVNSQGQTMVVIPGPVEFKMGSPRTESERDPGEQQHRRRISRSFAIAAKPVTVKQIMTFPDRQGYLKQYAPNEDCPVHGQSWYAAAQYCNWLSKQEGLPEKEWCYQPIEALPLLGVSTAGLLASGLGQGPFLAASAACPTRTDDFYMTGMKLAPDYLKRRGYRLPTEAEWEYACRAGAVTARYYGESEELLGKYGWYVVNSQERSWPVGSKKPNDLGLFDMHGNVMCWCQESWHEHPKPKDDESFEDKEEDVLTIAASTMRTFRGASFQHAATSARCANCLGRDLPSQRSFNLGFRVARTLR
jgi:formylglycine-generating enzyme required for sulfatase activity